MQKALAPATLITSCVQCIGACPTFGNPSHGRIVQGESPLMALQHVPQPPMPLPLVCLLSSHAMSQCKNDRPNILAISQQQRVHVVHLRFLMPVQLRLVSRLIILSSLGCRLPTTSARLSPHSHCMPALINDSCSDIQYRPRIITTCDVCHFVRLLELRILLSALSHASGKTEKTSPLRICCLCPIYPMQPSPTPQLFLQLRPWTASPLLRRPNTHCVPVNEQMIPT